MKKQSEESGGIRTWMEIVRFEGYRYTNSATAFLAVRGEMLHLMNCIRDLIPLEQ